MSYKSPGTDVVNVQHFQSLDALPLADPTVFADVGLMLESLLTELRLAQANTYFFVDYTVQNVTQDRLLGTAAWPTYTNGGATGVLASAQIVALLIFNTVVPRTTGRVNIGGMTEANIAASALDAAFVTAMLLYGARLLIPQIITSGRLLYTVYNRVLATQTDPLSATAIANVRTQRRRTQFFGT